MTKQVTSQALQKVGKVTSEKMRKHHLEPQHGVGIYVGVTVRPLCLQQLPPPSWRYSML